MSQSQCGVALVGRYPANKLMERIPIPRRPKPIPRGPCGPREVPGIKLPFRRLSPGGGQVGYALLTRAPVAIGGGKPPPCCPTTCMC